MFSNVFKLFGAVALTTVPTVALGSFALVLANHVRSLICEHWGRQQQDRIVAFFAIDAHKVTATKKQREQPATIIDRANAWFNEQRCMSLVDKMADRFESIIARCCFHYVPGDAVNANQDGSLDMLSRSSPSFDTIF
jgi:hypothetical protein